MQATLEATFPFLHRDRVFSFHACAQEVVGLFNEAEALVQVVVAGAGEVIVKANAPYDVVLQGIGEADACAEDEAASSVQVYALDAVVGLEVLPDFLYLIDELVDLLLIVVVRACHVCYVPYVA